VGGQRKSLIDVELARTEFRLDVLKLRKQLAEAGLRRDQATSAPEVALVTTREGTSIEPAGETAADAPATRPEPARAGSV
jgi:hypothetical protein